MSSVRRFRFLLLAAVVATAACSPDGGPTAPRALTPPGQADAGLLSWLLKPVVSTTDDLLHSTLIAERDSVRTVFTQDSTLAQPAYDSELADWQLTHVLGDDGLLASALNTVTHLLRCEPLPFASDAEVIGSDGGLLHIGPHTLTIPSGALDHEVLITASAPVGSLVQVQFGPQGLAFAKPATLELSYAHCVLPILRTYRIAYVDDRNTVQEFPPSTDSSTLKAVDGRIGHFSSYMIAY